jgi:hypothetical protein
MTTAARTEAGNLWRCIASPDGAATGDPAISEAAAQRLAELVTPSLAHSLLAELELGRGRPLLDPALVRASRLATRFARRQQLTWARAIAGAGIEVVYLKGFAAAHSLYSDPDVRTIGDLDVLVRPGDVGCLVDLLSRHGFRFAASPRRRWGFIEDASFAPFVSPDGHCDIDIHRHPDSYPVHTSLSTEMVFDAAVVVLAEGLPIRIPCREHALLLAATNAARDKFGVFSVRQTIDALVLLRDGPAPDWRVIEDLARRGGYLAPLRVFAALLLALGLPTDRVPQHLGTPPEGLRGREFARLVRQWGALLAEDQTLWATLRRELLLCAEPSTGFRRNLARLVGLFRPRDGVPGRAVLV